MTLPRRTRTTTIMARLLRALLCGCCLLAATAGRVTLGPSAFGVGVVGGRRQVGVWEVVKRTFARLFIWRRELRGKVTKTVGSIETESSALRLRKELSSFWESPPTGCALEDYRKLRSWTVSMTGAKGTVFAEEKYRLRLEFPAEYPSKPPRAFFLKPVPRHTHVYSNGDICLNILGADWSPSMTAEGLVVSILSMLSSAKEKGIPQDNLMHATESPGKQQDNWMYHDERC